MMSKKECDPLEEYFADGVATDFLAQAESNPNAAKETLLLAARYIRRGEALPGNLAEYLAGAIEAAMAQPEKHRAKILTEKLNLTVNNRRPAADWAMIGGEVEQLINKGSTQKKAFEDMANEYGISKSTVKRYWEIYSPVAAKCDANIRAALTKEHLEKVKRITR